EARLFDSGRALGARTNVGLQGTYPEAHLVIEEEVDLVWKQVSVDHGVSELTTAVGVHWFQAFRGCFGVTLAECGRSRFVPAQRFERPPNLVAGAMDVGLHGSQGQLECRGDLLLPPDLAVPP